MDEKCFDIIMKNETNKNKVEINGKERKVVQKWLKHEKKVVMD